MRLVCTTTALALSLSLVGCVADTGEESELPDVLDDGKADSLSNPTDFGKIYNDTWQYGELSPAEKVKNAAFRFDIAEGDATVTFTTRQSSDEDETTDNTVLYIYKKRTASSWKKVAKTTTDGFATLSRELAKGSYRLIVKGHAVADSGEFMVRMDCEGGGCLINESILEGSLEDAYARKHGSLIGTQKVQMKSNSHSPDRVKRQAVATVRDVTGLEVNTFEEAIALIDGGVFERYIFLDRLTGRSVNAFQFSYEGKKSGEFFIADGTEAAGHITNGKVDTWLEAANPRTCVFGGEYHDTRNMPGVTLVKSIEVEKAEDITSDELLAQLLDSVTWDGQDQVPTLDNIFENIDNDGFTVNTYQVEEDGNVRIYTGIDFGSGDTSVGWYYNGQTTERVAEISDAFISDCVAFY